MDKENPTAKVKMSGYLNLKKKVISLKSKEEKIKNIILAHDVVLEKLLVCS